ncbi:MAG: carotenoid oxygenase family protein [Pseudomonadota bacterium]
MAEPVLFPDIDLYRDWGAPMRVESEMRDLEVIHGAVPLDLDGRLYRCGPDRQYPPMSGNDIFIDGEGMVHSFTFKNGHVDYRSRWVRNERYLLQEAARRSLFGRYRNRYTNDPSVAGKNQTTSNTSIIWHAGKLLALKEDSLPTELNPDYFFVEGEHNYAGKVSSVSLSAHPKLDYARNELITFSYQAQGDGTTDFVFYVIGPDGKVAHQIPLTMPYAGMVHDFAITDTHLVVPFFPLITDMDVVKKGGPYYQWHGDKECHVAIVPRRGLASEVRWFKGPSCSAGHMMNAFNDGSVLHLDLCLYAGNCFPFFPSADGSAFKPGPPMLTRLSFNLDGVEPGFSSRMLGTQSCELPQIDERFNGKPYRYGYTVCYQPPRRTSRLGVWDLQKGEITYWEPGPDSAIQEAKFVPKGPGEGNGYLLVPVNRLTEMRSDLAILDARDVTAGPIALIKLPIRMRSTFHGCWVPAATLRSGSYSYP